MRSVVQNTQLPLPLFFPKGMLPDLKHFQFESRKSDSLRCFLSDTFLRLDQDQADNKEAMDYPVLASQLTLPIDNLASLDISLPNDADLQLLQYFRVLSTLPLSISRNSRYSATDDNTIKHLSLPKSLTAFSFSFELPVDLSSILRQVPQLKRFEVFPRDSYVCQEVLQITYLPPTLQAFEQGAFCAAFDFACDLPPSLIYFAPGYDGIDVTHTLTPNYCAMTNLRVLNITTKQLLQKGSVDEPFSSAFRLLPLPPSLSHLGIQNPFPLLALSLIPSTISSLHAPGLTS